MTENSLGASPTGRRPIKSRQWPFFQQLAAILARNRISPNLISVLSVVAAIGAGSCLAATSYVQTDFSRQLLWFVSAIFIQLRLIANLLDGMVAVEGGRRTPVGELYNEIPDRISDTAIFVGAGFAVGGTPLIGLLAALVSVFVAYLRAVGASLGVGQVFAGPCAKPQRMAVMTANSLVHAIVPGIFLPVHAVSGMGLNGVVLLTLIVGSVITAVRRLQIISKRLRQAADSRTSDE